MRVEVRANIKGYNESVRKWRFIGDQDYSFVLDEDRFDDLFVRSWVTAKSEVS